MMRFAALVLAVSALPAFAEVPKVVTDIPPVTALVAQVMGDLGQPVQMLERGADEHDMQLRPSQVAALSQATLLVWIGPNLTPGLDTARQAAPDLVSLALLNDPATMRLDYDAGGINPHAWLDPNNAKAWLGPIATALAMQDPDHAPNYRANADKARLGLETLDTTLAARLEPIRARPFITYHNAYGYFATHYGLAYDGALALGDAALPGAARISALQQRALQDHVTCAFPEVQHDPALLAQFTDAGVRLGPALDPVGALLDPGPDAYAILLTDLADALTTCLTLPAP